MLIKSFFSGIFVKLITGFDDTMVHLPVLTNLTKTKRGRFAFATGIFIAITLAVLISILFASAIRLLPYYHYISASLILILAFIVYFELFTPKKNKKVKKQARKLKKISSKRIFQLMGIGFITAFATVIDDTLAYTSLFISKGSEIPAALGVLTATLIQLSLIIFFSKKISNIRYRKQITTIGLVILSILIFFKVL